MNWPTALTSIGLWLSGARAHGGQRAGLGLMRGPQATIPMAEAGPGLEACPWEGSQRTFVTFFLFEIHIYRAKIHMYDIVRE